MSTPFFSKVFLFIKRFFAFAGPGYLVAVGYMDPGNWATDLAGGARFGYTLLSIIVISNFMAMLLQFCALKLGIVTGKDLARACRDYYPKPVSIILWILAELAVIATDLAEVIGSAIGLNLLFGIPLIWGVCITAADVLLLLVLAHNHAKTVQLLVTLLIGAIMLCFGIIVFIAQPSWPGILHGLVPRIDIITDPQKLYIAIGILGATVMPHNLYLHSALVKNETFGKNYSKKESILFTGIDSCVALTIAFFVNAAILIVAAAVFYERGMYSVSEIQDAYYLLTPLLSTSVASFVFALALLISGQNSTLTGTLAGQIILEGFINISIPAWLRRLIGRLITIIPAILGIIIFGECCLSHMMIASQIILSLQLPFAVFPLIQFTSNKKIMGEFANSSILSACALLIGVTIVIVNVLLLFFLFSPSY
jgi:manganese transport protein